MSSKPRTDSLVGALFLVALVIGAVLAFIADGVSRGPSLWHYLIADTVTRGAIRLVILAICLYVVLSLPMLAFRGRWIKSVGPSGVTVDEGMSSEEGRRISLAVSAVAEEVREIKALIGETQRGSID